MLRLRLRSPGRVTLLAQLAPVAALAHHPGQYVVRQLQPRPARVLLDAQQTTIDEDVDLAARHPAEVVEVDAVAVTRGGEQTVLDEAAGLGPDQSHAALVVAAQDLGAAFGDQLRRDLLQLGLASQPGLVELATEDAEDRWIQAQILELPFLLPRPRRDADDPLGHHGVDQLAVLGSDHLQGLRTHQMTEPHPVVDQRGHQRLELFELRQEVLAQAQDDLVGMLVEQEAASLAGVRVEAPLDLLGGSAFDQVCQLGEEGTAARQQHRRLGVGEHLLELVENQNRGDQPVTPGPEQLVTAVEVLPKGRRPLRRGRLDRLCGRCLHDGIDRLPDEIDPFFAGVEPDIDGQEQLLAQQRKEAGQQQRGLAHAGGREEDRQPCPPHPTLELRGLRPAAVEEGFIGLAEGGQPGPGILGRQLSVDAGLGLGLEDGAHRLGARARSTLR